MVWKFERLVVWNEINLTCKVAVKYKPLCQTEKKKSHRNIYITKSNGFIYAITIPYYVLEILLRGYVVFFHRINNQSKQKSKGHKEDLKLMNMITYYIDFGASFTGSFICPTSDCIHSVKFFEHQLYLNKNF